MILEEFSYLFLWNFKIKTHPFERLYCTVMIISWYKRFSSDIKTQHRLSVATYQKDPHPVKRAKSGKGFSSESDSM